MQSLTGRSDPQILFSVAVCVHKACPCEMASHSVNDVRVDRRTYRPRSIRHCWCFQRCRLKTGNIHYSSMSWTGIDSVNDSIYSYAPLPLIIAVRCLPNHVNNGCVHLGAPLLLLLQLLLLLIVHWRLGATCRLAGWSGTVFDAAFRGGGGATCWHLLGLPDCVQRPSHTYTAVAAAAAAATHLLAVWSELRATLCCCFELITRRCLLCGSRAAAHGPSLTYSPPWLRFDSFWSSAHACHSAL